jgi:hypothetical protein
MCQSIVSAHYEYIYASCKYQEALVPLVPDHQQIPNPAQPLQIFGALQQAIPLPAPIPPLRQRQINQQAANQQVANQRPRLLEEAAARQQATAEAAVTPQRQVINPDAEWLQMLPHAMQEMRSPDQFHSPITTPEDTPPVKHYAYTHSSISCVLLHLAS